MRVGDECRRSIRNGLYSFTNERDVPALAAGADHVTLFGPEGGPTPTGLGDSMTMKKGLSAVLLILAVLAVYMPTMRGGFVWDDDEYVVNNMTLRSAGGLARIWFQPGAVPQYYPLVHTTFWLEYRLWGLHPFGFHLVNVLLHAAVALLLIAALEKLKVPGAWLAGAIFALHPVQVESVAWITERKNVLSGVFYLLALLAYLRFAPPEGEPTRGASRRRWYFASLGLFACALLAKTVTATLPAAILLLTWWKRGRIRRRDCAPLIPYVLLGLAAGGMTAWMERVHVGARGAEWDLSLPARILVAGRAIWFYVAKLIWPTDLTFIYARWRIHIGNPWEWLYPLAVAAAFALLVRLRRQTGRGPLAGFIFHVGTLTPALGFFDVYPMRHSFVADHFQYLASIGLIALAVAGCVSVARTWSDSRAARPMLAVAAALVLAFLGRATWQRGSVYLDLETLWQDTIARNPSCWMAQHNLGMVYETRGEIDRAIVQYRRAVDIRPDLEATHFNLGTMLARAGDLSGARASFQEALRIRPAYAEAWNNLGNVLTLQEEIGAAIDAYRRAVALDPAHASAHRNLGFALGKAGDAAGAEEELRASLHLEPEDASTMNLLAWLLATSPDEELRDGAEAVRLAEAASAAAGGKDMTFLRTLAAAYAEAGRFDDAESTIDRAIELGRAAGRSDVAESYRAYRDLFGSRRPYRTLP
jgi:protein O-mannosyl-transferase